MSDSTPYDAERASYSREALARLALSDHAVEAADSAAGLVGTRHDVDTGPGGRVSQAHQLTELAQQVLISAVIYERERGSSWTQIAAYLGITAEETEERYTPAVERWDTAFAVPYRLDETGRKRIPQLPQAAYNPVSASNSLDLWAFVHQIMAKDEHAVSAGLTMATGPEDGGDTDDLD